VENLIGNQLSIKFLNDNCANGMVLYNMDKGKLTSSLMLTRSCRQGFVNKMIYSFYHYYLNNHYE
jgi:hypothetical protein